MIEHESVVAVVHFEERCARHPVTVAVLYEATGGEPQPTTGVGETDDLLLRDQGLYAHLQALCSGIRRKQFEDRNLLGMRTCQTPDADGNRPLVLSRVSTCFQSWSERRMAVATCSAVTIDAGERNQAVPRIPSTPVFCSPSSKYLEMLAVE